MHTCSDATEVLNLVRKSNYKSPNYRIKKIVIDPGHGGHDGGCSGANSTEKHIALAVAKKAKTAIQQAHPDVEVILTRDRDVFVPLHERAAIANRNNADLFISIHCNSFRGVAYGSETYVLGPHRLAENLEVAKRENASILLETDYEKNYDYDPNSDEGHIIMSLFQNAYQEQSLAFAERVEHHGQQAGKLRSRGVKQAGFLVLRETAMPSVLIETGYLTHAKDERILLSNDGQQSIAQCITNAFSEFRILMENGESASDFVAKTSTNKDNVPVLRPSSPPAPKVIIEQPLPAQKSTANAPPPAVKTKQTTTTTYNDTYAYGDIREPVIQFRVQLAASRKPLDIQTGKWANIQDFLIQVIKEDGYFKYQATGYADYQTAVYAKKQLANRGFQDTWMVAYRNGEKITVTQALKELE